MRALLLPALALLFATGAAALEIAKVRADRVTFDPVAGEDVAIAFRLTAPARVELRLYDGRELLVRSVESDGVLPGGDHMLRWDGRDAAGRPAPPEAYHYVLRATGEGGGVVVHDLTDKTGGEPLAATNTAWDREAGMVRYVLPALGRVNLRLGLPNGGPLLRTLVDWAPREAGARAERWDGRDASGVLSLESHPELGIVVNAFALPANTVLVGPPQPEVRLIDDVSWEAPERAPHEASGRQRRAYAAQPIEVRRDVTIALELPAELPRTDAGLPIVSGPVPVRMAVPDADEAARMLAERFETAFFLDGQYRFENEVGFLPATWVFDPAGVAEGEHYITGNLLGYEGHFGIATVAVYVKPAGWGE